MHQSPCIFDNYIHHHKKKLGPSPRKIKVDTVTSSHAPFIVQKLSRSLAVVPILAQDPHVTTKNHRWDDSPDCIEGGYSATVSFLSGGNGGRKPTQAMLWKKRGLVKMLSNESIKLILEVAKQHQIPKSSIQLSFSATIKWSPGCSGAHQLGVQRKLDWAWGQKWEVPSNVKIWRRPPTYNGK